MKRNRKRYPFSIFNTAGLEAVVCYQDDPDPDASSGGSSTKSDQDPGASSGDTGGKVQGETDPSGAKAPEPGKSSSADLNRIRSLEAKAKKDERELEKLRASEKKRSDADKTELEKAQESAKLEQGKAADAESKLLEMRVENALRDKAAGAGARADRLAGVLGLIDRGSVTVEDDGTLAGVEAAVEAVKKGYPEFFGATSTSSPSTGGGKSGDRGAGGDDGPKSDYEVGQALAKKTKETKSRL